MQAEQIEVGDKIEISIETEIENDVIVFDVLDVDLHPTLETTQTFTSNVEDVLDVTLNHLSERNAEKIWELECSYGYTSYLFLDNNGESERFHLEYAADTQDIETKYYVDVSVDEFNSFFRDINRTEVDGPVKVEDVVGLDVSDGPIGERGPVDLPPSEVSQDTETLWVDVGDTFKKREEVGRFEITVLKILRVDEEKDDGEHDIWYEVEVEHKPIVPETNDEKTRTPLVKKQTLRSFAREAVNFSAIDDAGKPPEERESTDGE